MCCRCVQAKKLDEIVKWWGEKIEVLITLSEFKTSFNVSPGQNLPVIFSRAGHAALSLMKWGLPAGFQQKEKEHEFLSYNARIETALQKKSFSQLMRGRRCTVLCSGYYEWKKEDGKSIPYFIYSPKMSILPLAGLWTESTDGNTKCFTVITKNARRAISHIHDRMPLILAEEKIEKWIDSKYFPTNPEEEFSDQKNNLEFHAVSTKVNSAKYDSSDCIVKEDYPEQGNLF
jgi:putative SOS response-associated peptidase YedK